MKKKQKDSLIVCCILTPILIYIGLKLGEGLNGSNFITGLDGAIGQLGTKIITNPFSVKPTAEGAVIAFILLAILWIAWLYFYFLPQPQRVGEEHGSSRWATLKEMLAFKNKENDDLNVVFSKNSGIATKKKGFDLKTDRNLNVAVIGGSGSGKTRYYVKPNLMQLHGNYFVTDPKGTVVEECGHLMNDNGYEIKCFNVIPDTMQQSLCYNPLYYIKSEEQILAFVNCLIKNTTPDKKSGGDPFWEKSETLLYVAVLSLMKDFLPTGDFCLPDLLYWLEFAQAKEEDENWQSPLDLLFQQVEKGCQYISSEPEGKNLDGSLRYSQEIEWWCRVSGQKIPDGASVDKAQEVDGFSVVSHKKDIQGLGILEPRPGMIDIPSLLIKNETNESFRDMYEKAAGAKLGKTIAKEEFLECGESEHFCVKKYGEFKSAAGKTLKSIIISCNVRLMPISIPSVSKILSGTKKMERDKEVAACEMELDKLGDPDKKMVIFAVMSDTNDTYFFLVAIMMYQVMDLLCNVALTKYKGKLPTFVHFIFDEFANLGVLADFNRTIAITRSRNIGVSMILQTPFQLEQNYSKEAAKVIIDNCDTMVYLGGGSDGSDASTCKEISARLGKETINTRTYNQSKGKNGSTSINNAIQARELLMPDEVARLPRDEELVLIKNTYPYKDKKFILQEHKRYDYIDPESHIGAKSKHSQNFNYYEYKEKYRQTIEAFGEDYESNPMYWKKYYNDLLDNLHSELKQVKSYVVIIEDALNSNQSSGSLTLFDEDFVFKNLKQLNRKYTEIKNLIISKQKEIDKTELKQLKKILEIYKQNNLTREYSNLIKRCEECNWEKSLSDIEKDIRLEKQNEIQNKRQIINKNKHREHLSNNILRSRTSKKVSPLNNKPINVPQITEQQIPDIEIEPTLDTQLQQSPQKPPQKSLPIDIRFYKNHSFNNPSHLQNFLNYLFACTQRHYNTHSQHEKYFFDGNAQFNNPRNIGGYLSYFQQVSKQVFDDFCKYDLSRIHSTILYFNHKESSEIAKKRDLIASKLPSLVQKYINTNECAIDKIVYGCHFFQKNNTPHMHIVYAQTGTDNNLLQDVLLRIFKQEFFIQAKEA